MGTHEVTAPDEDLSELVQLWTSARTPAQLRQLLIAHGAVPTELIGVSPVDLFTSAHGGDPSDIAETAALLCTGWKADASLLEAIVATGLLDDAALDELATRLLTAGDLRVWVPGEWFAGPEIVLGDSEVNDDPADDLEGCWESRPIPPQARRWAADRALRSGLRRVDEVAALAERLGSRAGAAVAHGLVDACPHLPGEASAEALAIGLDWPDGAVRLAAVRLLAQRDGVEAAAERAGGDRNGLVRRWAERAVAAPPTLFDT